MPSRGHPTRKVGHTAEQKVINLLFLTSKDKLWALALTSKKCLSHEGKWDRFSLTHGQGINGREEEVTENDHQKSYREWWRPRGWAYGLLLELFMCLHRCTEVFLLGAGTLGVSSPFHGPLILSWESSSGRRPNGL